MEKSKIQWTDATWNPFYGCRKVSAECKFCYMYRDQQRYGRNPSLVTKSKTTFNKPLSWKEPKLIFTCSWSDWFIEEADPWRDELWKIIKATPQHTYQILTKRPERILQCLPADWGEGYNNVWLGVSVGNNESLHRCKTLGEIPAKIKFISAEPLLEELNELNEVLQQYKFDWCIIGGESGNNIGKYRFRECYIEWIEDAINACQINDVKVFVKQLGTFLGKQMQLKDSHGGNMDEWPQKIQIREFPLAIPFLHKEPKPNARKKKSKPLTISYTGYLASLTPFKKLIALEILSGLTKEEAAEKLAKKYMEPLRTYKAYATMVANGLEDYTKRMVELKSK